MKIIFDLGHPAHVHLFKYTIRNLKENGHDIKICVRERENIVGKLLEFYNFEYENIEANIPGLMNKAVAMVKNDYKLLKIANKFKPDIFVSITSPYSAQVSTLMGKPFIAFTDSEPTRLILSLTLPFTNTVITPIGFNKDLGEKHVRIKGFKELAYLHPNWFKPDPNILNMLNVSKDEKYVILRFNAFDSSHDIGVKGFSLADKRKLVNGLKEHAKIFISSELKLPSDLEKYAIDIPPHKMHDALYYACLLVGDTQTLTTESACLGIPAIRCNSFVGTNDMSNFVELEENYGLIFNYNDSKKAIEKSLNIIQEQNIGQEWKHKMDKLHNDKIDVTAFFTWFIEEYPKSFGIIREHLDYQDRFK